MNYFPLYIDLSGRTVLVAGGGKVALAKVRQLQKAHAKIIVCSPLFLKEFETLENVTCLKRPYGEDLLDGITLVICAVDDKELAARVYEDCQKRNILINCADMPEYCDVIFGAIAEAGPLVACFSTQGASPAAAGWIRDQFEAAIPDDLPGILEWLGEVRPHIIDQVPAARRRQFFTNLFLECLLNEGPLDEDKLEAEIEHAKA